MRTTPTLLAFVCLTFAGCQTAQMQIPEPLAAIAPLDVEGADPRRWNAPIRFGPWATTEVREGLTWNFSERLLGIEAGVAFQPYRLVVSSGADPIQAECTTYRVVLSRNGLSVDPSFGKIPTLACAFRGTTVGEGSFWLHTTATNAEEGDVDFPDGVWTVRSIRRFQGSSIVSGTPLGYEVRKRDRVIGAVETINRGRVWMDPSLSERERLRLAAVTTALLLYEPAGGGGR